MWYAHVELMGRRRPRSFLAENMEDDKVDENHKMPPSV